MNFCLRQRCYLNSGDIIFWSDFAPSHAQFICFTQDEVVLESLKAHDIRHYKARTDVATGSHKKHSPLNSSRLACQSRPMVVTITMTRTSGHLG